MRHWYIVLLVLACGRPAPQTIRSDTAAGRDGLRDEAARGELTRVEDEWEQAAKAHDAAFFQRTMSDDFVGTTLEGISDKSALVRANADTNMSVDSISRSEEKIRIYGNGNVGVITGRFAVRGRAGGRRLGTEFRYTEVWVKRDARWQVVAGHYTPVEKPKK